MKRSPFLHHVCSVARHRGRVPLTLSAEQTAFWTHWEGVSNATDAPTVLYLHGGGRVVGNSSSYIGASSLTVLFCCPLHSIPA